MNLILNEELYFKKVIYFKGRGKKCKQRHKEKKAWDKQ